MGIKTETRQPLCGIGPIYEPYLEALRRAIANSDQPDLYEISVGFYPCEGAPGLIGASIVRRP